MTEVWKPKQDRLPAITIVTQTSTKMPYSKLPIQRASSTWLTKAIAGAEDADGEGDQRHAAGLAALVGGRRARASTRSSSGRARSARRSGSSRSAVVAAEKRTHYTPSSVKDRTLVETV